MIVVGVTLVKVTFPYNFTFQGQQRSIRAYVSKPSKGCILFPLDQRWTLLGPTARSSWTNRTFLSTKKAAKFHQTVELRSFQLYSVKNVRPTSRQDYFRTLRSSSFRRYIMKAVMASATTPPSTYANVWLVIPKNWLEMKMNELQM